MRVEFDERERNRQTDKQTGERESLLGTIFMLNDGGVVVVMCNLMQCCASRYTVMRAVDLSSDI
jgi:hypothetical protein